MENYYTESWEFYKSHSEYFKDDFDYYLNFTRNYSTLELFAGYGRLTNHLYCNDVEIESVELEPRFANYITIPAHNNHISNVLTFEAQRQFERIIAAYNSFCLLTKDEDISRFFMNVSSWLVSGGKASLSYFHPDAWLTHNGVESKFKFRKGVATHIVRCDLSNRSEGWGIWSDEYVHESKRKMYSYPTRIYESSQCLMPFLKETDLVLTEVIKDYNCKNMSETGWVEYVLCKK